MPPTGESRAVRIQQRHPEPDRPQRAVRGQPFRRQGQPGHAEESTRRSKAQVFKFNKRNSKAGREWYDWLPIHDMLVGEVFGTIEAAGEKAHWAYAAGMSRLSCCFCIMSNRQDLVTAARLNPFLYRRYVETEKRIGHTMTMPRKDEEPRGLEEITDIPVVIETEQAA